MMLRMSEGLSICVSFPPVLVEKGGGLCGREVKAKEQTELPWSALKNPGPAGSLGLSPKQNDSNDGRIEKQQWDLSTGGAG